MILGVILFIALSARAPSFTNPFQKVNNVEVKYKIVGRRAGDIATCYADPSKAKKELGWVAEKGIEDMCRDSWNFIVSNK